MITSAFITYRQEQIRAAGQDPVAIQLEDIAQRLATIETELQQLRDDRSSDGGR
jgi:hypothetical protein